MPYPFDVDMCVTTYLRHKVQLFWNENLYYLLCFIAPLGVLSVNAKLLEHLLLLNRFRNNI